MRSDLWLVVFQLWPEMFCADLAFAILVNTHLAHNNLLLICSVCVCAATLYSNATDMALSLVLLCDCGYALAIRQSDGNRV